MQVSLTSPSKRWSRVENLVRESNTKISWDALTVCGSMMQHITFFLRITRNKSPKTMHANRSKLQDHSKRIPTKFASFNATVSAWFVSEVVKGTLYKNKTPLRKFDASPRGFLGLQAIPLRAADPPPLDVAQLDIAGLKPWGAHMFSTMS